MGVFARGNRLWLRLKGPDGKWVSRPTKYVVGQESQAKRTLANTKAAIASGVEVVGRRAGPVTVEEYVHKKWFPARRACIADWRTSEARMRIHVLPRIGKLPIADVRPRHLVDLFRDLRSLKRAPAPRSIRNIYSQVKALFRDATIDELVPSSPCVLTAQHLGVACDADPEWRPTAMYTREELERLISDAVVPADRQIMYGLEGLGALRHGEAAGLRWRHLDLSRKPLGAILVCTSYDKGRTKTEAVRSMPIHPTLAAMLAEWKFSGWRSTYGRDPEPNDLVCPHPKSTVRGRRVKEGSMRTEGASYKRLMKDLAALGFRHRRGHDLRRTFISLAISDGARKDLIERATHTPASGKAIDLYLSVPWVPLCAEVLKLQVSRRGGGELIALPKAVNAAPPQREARHMLVTAKGKTMQNSGLGGIAAIAVNATAGAGSVGLPAVVDAGARGSGGLATAPGSTPGVSAASRSLDCNDVTSGGLCLTRAQVDLIRRALITGEGLAEAFALLGGGAR